MTRKPEAKTENKAEARPAIKTGPASSGTLKTGSSAPAVPARTLEQAIGVKVRGLRRSHDLTVAELAGAAGISTGMLSKIENGAISASLATLQAIAHALSTPLASLFSTFDESRDCSHVKAGQGVIIERRGTKVGHQYELLGHSLSGDVAAEPYLITLTDEAVPYTAFQHEGIEFIHMLKGRVRYRHGERSYLLGPGDSLFFDAGALHGPEELIEKPMQYLSIIMWPRQR
jgi:transcriptional regulator with XRE-family HTH domain